MIACRIYSIEFCVLYYLLCLLILEVIYSSIVSCSFCSLSCLGKLKKIKQNKASDNEIACREDGCLSFETFLKLKLTRDLI